MKLFEISDLGGARSVLSVLQGQANVKKIPSEIPFQSFKNLINGDDIGVGTPNALIALKDKLDPTGDVIQDILDNGTIVLNTTAKSQTKDQTPVPGSSPSVDKMASSAAKQAISSKI